MPERMPMHMPKSLMFVHIMKPLFITFFEKTEIFLFPEIQAQEYLNVQCILVQCCLKIMEYKLLLTIYDRIKEEFKAELCLNPKGIILCTFNVK